MSKKSTATGEEAWARFLATHAMLVERIELTLAEAELPPLAWYDALWALEQAEGGRLRMHELAHAVVLSRSNVTRLIDRLEDAKLIRRERCADDRRGFFAELTPAGREMRRRIWPVYRAQIESLFSAHLSAEEARVMKAMLEKLLQAVQQA